MLWLEQLLKGSEEGCKITLWGTRDLHYYQLSQIKRVRIVRRADGYYAQFLIDYERVEKRSPSYKDVAAVQVVLIRGLATVGHTVKMLSEGKVVGLPVN